MKIFGGGTVYIKDLYNRNVEFYKVECVICVTVSHKLWPTTTDVEQSEALEQMGAEFPDVLVH